MGNWGHAKRRVSQTAAAVVAALAVLLGAADGALTWQTLTAEEELARRFAPVIILQRQDEPCDEEGEPYLPSPVDVVFSDRAVTLREGPRQEPAKSPVENPDLFERQDDFATDLPCKPRDPGCDYENHFKAVMGNRRPVIYAHISTEEGKPGIALQFWFFLNCKSRECAD
jgi:hypothetical protein